MKAAEDGGDHIEEGTIDPDNVEDDAEALGVGSSWQGWDCREGYAAHRSGAAHPADGAEHTATLPANSSVRPCGSESSTGSAATPGPSSDWSLSTASTNLMR